MSTRIEEIKARVEAATPDLSICPACGSDDLSRYDTTYKAGGWSGWICGPCGYEREDDYVDPDIPYLLAEVERLNTTDPDTVTITISREAAENYRKAEDGSLSLYDAEIEIYEAIYAVIVHAALRETE